MYDVRIHPLQQLTAVVAFVCASRDVGQRAVAVPVRQRDTLYAKTGKGLERIKCGTAREIYHVRCSADTSEVCGNGQKAPAW